jgi:hypothetical protein
LKFKEEEDFQTIIWGQAERDSKSKDGQIDFISILRIGLISVLKVDRQTADWLLSYIGRDFNGIKYSCQGQKARSVICCQQRPPKKILSAKEIL